MDPVTQNIFPFVEFGENELAGEETAETVSDTEEEEGEAEVEPEEEETDEDQTNRSDTQQGWYYLKRIAIPLNSWSL